MQGQPSEEQTNTMDSLVYSRVDQTLPMGQLTNRLKDRLKGPKPNETGTTELMCGSTEKTDELSNRLAMDHQARWLADKRMDPWTDEELDRKTDWQAS